MNYSKLFSIPTLVAAATIVSLSSAQLVNAQTTSDYPYWWLNYNIGDESDDKNLYPFFTDYTEYSTQSPEELEMHQRNFLALVDQRGTFLQNHECYLPITVATSEACINEYGPFVPFARLIDSEGEFADSVNELVLTDTNIIRNRSTYNPNFFTRETVTYADFMEPQGTAQYIPDGRQNPYSWLASPALTSELNQYNDYVYGYTYNDTTDNSIEEALEEISYTGLPAVSATAIREEFDRVGEESIQNRYTNESFSEASWDIQSYVAHPCFNVVGYEIASCMEQFGQNYNLKELLLSKELDEILAVEIAEAPGLARLLDAAREEITLNETLQELYDREDEFDNSTVYSDSFRDRTNAVWDYCTNRYSYEQAVLCYAENDRFYLDASVPFIPTYSDL